MRWSLILLCIAMVIVWTDLWETHVRPVLWIISSSFMPVMQIDTSKPLVGETIGRGAFVNSGSKDIGPDPKYNQSKSMWSASSATRRAEQSCKLVRQDLTHLQHQCLSLSHLCTDDVKNFEVLMSSAEWIGPAFLPAICWLLKGHSVNLSPLLAAAGITGGLKLWGMQILTTHRQVVVDQWHRKLCLLLCFPLFDDY